MFRNKKVKVHFVGIGGIGMSGIAELLLNLGYRVSGSDLKESDITKRLASLGEGGSYLWDVAAGKQEHPLQPFAAFATGLRFAPDGKELYAVNDFGEITVWDTASGKQERKVTTGNANPAIHHIFVITQGSYDPFLWQKVDDKARFTRQMLDPNDNTRVIAGLSRTSSQMTRA